MTVEELLAREGIRQTMADYTMAGDRLRIDDFVGVFTEDAVLESEGVPESDAFRYASRAEIHDWMSRWSRPGDGTPKPHQATFIRHHLATSQIQLTGPDTAKARTYWVAYTDIGPDHCGYYLDAFRREGGRWLISHRRIRLDWRSDQSLYTQAILSTAATPPGDR
ncbi:nuclear transport factor 2 family protein [Phenylobacterium sp. LjRoot225]|uniref:nuclear transport factor 2 family protein n=1 Tax=Phenylobacterium sp. LjRoot225 TaxID=3342285 RepID=UPI003ECCF23F